MSTRLHVIPLEQQVWLGKLSLANADAAVWRPSDWPKRVTAELQAIA